MLCWSRFKVRRWRLTNIQSSLRRWRGRLHVRMYEWVTFRYSSTGHQWSYNLSNQWSRVQTSGWDGSHRNASNLPFCLLKRGVFHLRLSALCKNTLCADLDYYFTKRCSIFGKSWSWEQRYVQFGIRCETPSASHLCRKPSPTIQIIYQSKSKEPSLCQGTAISSKSP